MIVGVLETTLWGVQRLEGIRGRRSRYACVKMCTQVRARVSVCWSLESVSRFNKLLMPLKDNHRWSSYNN